MEVKSAETNGGSIEENKKEEEDGRNGSSLVCENNFEDRGYCGNGEEDSLIGKDKVEEDGCGAVLDQDVDVVGFGEGTEVVVEMAKNDDPDATENSSSFGNTFSGSDNEEKVGDEEEVDSQFSMENGEQPVAEGTGRLFRRKKVTAHWRRFISPLMWRCQWLELRMNELRSQALIYDKQLEGYKHEKQLQSKMIELDDSVSKSVPLTCQSHRKRAMKRLKRKRNEDTVDISSYMSNHCIFSYYENKKTETDGHSVDDACDDQVIEDIIKGNEDPDWSTLGVSGDNSLEKILFNIEDLQLRVRRIQEQLGKVMCLTSRDISLSAGNVLQGDLPASYVQRDNLSPVNNHGDSMPLHNGDDSAVSSYGDAADIGMIEGSMGLLAADASMPPVNEFLNDIPEDGLISNPAGDKQHKNFQKVSYGKEKLEEIEKEETQSCSDDEKTPSPPPSVQIPGLAGQSSRPPVLQRTYTGKKRGRKAKANRNRRGPKRRRSN